MRIFHIHGKMEERVNPLGKLFQFPLRIPSLHNIYYVHHECVSSDRD